MEVPLVAAKAETDAVDSRLRLAREMSGARPNFVN
jgi:hypothetical protein